VIEPNRQTLSAATLDRTKDLFGAYRQRIFRQTDRLFAGLMVAQWIAGIAVVAWLSPLTWIGATHQPHPHWFSAIFLGGAICLPPVALAFFSPGTQLTRHIIAVCQMLFSGLLIDLTGGRIETHFHIFGSLALLAFYRDWPVLVSATVVTALDHLLGGFFWPMAIYGTPLVSPWRWVEHAFWVVFADVFLIQSNLRNVAEMWSIAQDRAELEATNAAIECTVEERTEELRGREEQTRQIIDTATDAVVTMDSAGQVEEWNVQAEAIFGWTRTDVLGRSLADLIVPATSKQAYQDGLAHFLATGKGPVLNRRMETVARHRDGHEFPVDVGVTAIRAGDSVVFSAFISDISQRERDKRRQKAEYGVARILAESPSLEEAAPAVLQELCQCLHWQIGVIWLVDRTAGVIRCVDIWHAPETPIREFAAATRRSMFAPGIGIPGRVWQNCDACWIADVATEMNFPRGPFAVQDGVHGAVGLPIALGHEVLGVLEFFSFTVREPDDETLTMMVSIGSQLGHFIERRQAEQALRIAEAKSRGILAAVPDTMFQVSPEGVFVDFHASEVVESAYSAESILGKSIQDIFDAKASRRLLSAMAAARAKGGVQTVEYQAVGADGKTQDHEARVAPMQTVGFLIVTRNVTDRNRLLCQLTHAQKLESIGQLAAGIAHEINTPIQYVGDNTRFLRDSFSYLIPLIHAYDHLLEDAQAGRLTPEDLSRARAALQDADLPFLVEEIPGAIEQTLDGIDRVAAIVRAMKEFSHPGGDQQQLTDINHCIESTIVVARNEWKYVAEVVTDLDPDLPMISCLPGDFNQVILNMIVNASHAIADAQAGVEGGKGTITISTRRCDPWLEIRVTDTGAGIPESIRSRIFDPFFTTKEVGKGTGQGLAIAYTVVVDRHGGTLDFESQEGQGTSFIIRLPLLSEAVELEEALG
jgi:PAS domain S-box-containing protein